MSKASRGRKIAAGHSRPPQIQPEVTPDVYKSVLTYIIMAILIAIPFSFGKYFEFNTNGPFDSGAYVYCAKAVLDGAQIGSEVKVSARMGTLLVNMLGVKFFGFSEFGPKLVQMGFQIIALVFMFVALLRLWGKWAAGISTFIASLYLSAPVIAKFGNVKEQYMIACMVIGVSCFVMRHLGGRWWWSVLCGMFVAWGPLFKQTGLSAIAAVGLFVLIQPIIKKRTWRQTGNDILLLIAGAIISLGPVYIWMITCNAPFENWPYAKIIRIFFPGQAERFSSYIARGRQLVSMEEVAYRVFRYYAILIMPIVLALGSLVLSIVRVGMKKAVEKDRFVILFGLWWILDMVFIWISPRSYEQYYLPLNASAAMLSGFVFGCYFNKLKTAEFKVPWVVAGIFGLVFIVVLSQQIVFGISKSPHSATVYKNPRTNLPEKRRGYIQRFKEVRSARANPNKSPWESVAEYIKERTQTDDKIFVWGWYPGIYVQAQRMSAATHAFTSEMHVESVEALTDDIESMLEGFKEQAPKFIVDTHKSHFPWNRPFLELWPVFNRLELPAWPAQSDFLPATEQAIKQYDTSWLRILKTHERFREFGEDEARRYEAMRPLRRFVMTNYSYVGRISSHTLFELKSAGINKE
jgi:4-amino-4-deoxy-L-arabinose transferase-like glycosyltransferase